MIKKNPFLPPESLMTADEVAKVLGVKVKAIYNRLATDAPFPIPVYRIGKRLRFKRDDVERLK